MGKYGTLMYTFQKPGATLILALVYLVLYKNKNGITRFIVIVLSTLLPVLCANWYTLYISAIAQLSVGIGSIALVDHAIVVIRIIIYNHPTRKKVFRYLQ